MKTTMVCLVFLLLTVSLISISVTGVMDKHCTESEVDLVIIVDAAPGASDPSTGVRTFEEIIGLTKRLLRPLTVGPNGTRVSLVSYANTTRVVSRLNSHMASSSLKVRALAEMKYRPSTRNATLALGTTRSRVLNVEKGDRPDALDLIILVSNGTSEHADLTQALNMVYGSKLFAIDVGANLNESRLLHIATSGVLTLNVSFTHGTDILPDLIHYACQEFKSSDVPLDDDFLSDQDEKPPVELNTKSDITSYQHLNLQEHYTAAPFDWPRTKATSLQSEAYRVVQPRTEFTETVFLEYRSSSHLSSGQFESSTAALSGIMEIASRVKENSTLSSANQFRDLDHSVDASLLDEGQGQKEKHISRLPQEISKTRVASELNVKSETILSDDLSALQATSYVEVLPIVTQLPTLLVTSRTDDLSISHGTPWTEVLPTRFVISNSEDVLMLSKPEDRSDISRPEDLSVISRPGDLSSMLLTRSTKNISVYSSPLPEDMSALFWSEDTSTLFWSEEVSTLLLSEDKSTLLVPSKTENSLLLSGKPRSEEVSTLLWSEDVSTLLLSEDTSTLLLSEDKSTLLVPSKTENPLLLSGKPRSEEVSTLLWSEDVSTLLLSEDKFTLLVPRKTENSLLLSVKPRSEEVSTLLWSEDTSTLLLSEDKSTLLVPRKTENSLLLSVKPWSEEVSTLLWSDDTSTLLWSEDVSTLLLSEDKSTLLVPSKTENPLLLYGKPRSEEVSTLLWSDDTPTLVVTSRTKEPLTLSEKPLSEDTSTLLVTSRAEDVPSLSAASKSSDFPTSSYSYLQETGFTAVVTKTSEYKSQNRQTDVAEITMGSLMSQTADAWVHPSATSDGNVHSSIDANDRSERGGELSGYKISNIMVGVLAALFILVALSAAVAVVYRKSLHEKRFDMAEMTSL